MKKTLIPILVLLLIAAGIYGSATLLKDPASNVNTMLVNKNEPVKYDLLPSGFDRVSEHLFSKQLSMPANAAAQGKRFREMADCGIKFSNLLERSKAFQMIETGSGLAIGDYDNDGLPDVYLVGCDIPNKLYRNLGDFKFEDVTSSAGVDGQINMQNTWGSGATFADVDNDGDLDLYVCNMAAPNLLYINQGDGTFVEQSIARKVNYFGASKIGAFCDYDRDGDLDIYLVTYQDRPATEKDPIVMVDGKPTVPDEFLEHVALIDGNRVAAGEQDILYRNNGDGTFEEVTKAAGIEGYDMGLSASWFDFDNDGWQDIYVTTDYKMPDHLYRNNQDGTFTDVLPEVVKHTPWFSMGSDTGDLNNDGLIDLMAADMSGASHYKQKLDMGSMGAAGWFLAQGNPRQYMKNCLFINSGQGPFMEMASMTGLSATDWTWAVRLVDMDNDGLLDVYVTNGHARDLMNGDIADRFDALTKKGYSVEEWDSLYLSVEAREEANLAFQNLGDLSFVSAGRKWGLDHVGVSHGAAFADLDLDGDLDLVVNNYYQPALVYQNETSKGTGTAFEFRCKENNFFGIGTKVEIWQAGGYQTRTLQPVRGYISADAPVVNFGTKPEVPIERVVVTWPDGSSQELKDLKPNHLYRVIESTERDPESGLAPTKTTFVDVTSASNVDFQHTERYFDDYAREPLLPYQLSELGAPISMADVNGDKFPDLYCGGAAGQAGALFINRDGKFEKQMGPWESDKGQEDTSALLFDADGDGDNDLYVVSGSNEFDADDPNFRDRLYINDGKGQFAKSKDGLPELTDSGSCVAAADFDQDGDLDLFVGSRSIPGQYPLTPTSRLLINDSGKFVEASGELAANLVECGLKNVGLVNSARWVDYDGDGWTDLIVALDWGPVTIFRNDKGKLSNVTEELGLADNTGWWQGIAAADLDKDGDLDLVLTNHGNNTKYHATAKRPTRLYYDDFDNNGTLDLVEAEFEGDIEYPMRGKSCSSNSMPFIGKKFGTYHEYALASLTDIYEPEIRKKTFREATFLDSAILWNEEGVLFNVQSLPKMAQISPAHGVAVADFDGDGIKDIALANNFFASQPETGFMDGGLNCLLKGLGKRKFDHVWPNRSGIAISDASYEVIAGDIDQDGDLDLVFSCNNGSVRVLENKTK